MGSVSPLLSFLLIVVSGWVHRHQLTVIEFLQAENRLLKQKLGGKRLRFTDAEGVQLVVAPIDYSENTRVLIDELRGAALINE